MKSKIKLAYWLVSHCKTQNHREDFAKELQRYIPVDIYGGCGPFKFMKRGSAHWAKHERKTLMMKYKFYLAFENTNCKDYISEKLFHHMGHGVVPIVMGGGNYSDILPKHSYIDVKDFESAKALADYLKHLDKNNGEYLKYFEWTKNYHWYVKLARCELCRKLNDPTEPYKSYENFTQWWFYDENGNPQCES